jgi:spore coat polysaccharide biosynthesis protein SpsF (cytidylyltransferase family)
MTLYIKEHPEEFRITTSELPPALYRPHYRLTVDEPEDVTLMQAIFNRLAQSEAPVATREAIALLDREPALAEINGHIRHKAANLRSVALDAGVQTQR